MSKIIVFGAGNNALKLKNCFKSNVELVAYIDNDQTKWDKCFNNKIVYSPSQGLKLDYQFVVIAVLNGYKKIQMQLMELGVQERDIIIPFSFEHDRYDEWREIFHVEELIYLEMDLKLERMRLYIENLEYELAAKIKKDSICYPKILSWEKAVAEIVKNGKSMSRYGDGEFDLILGIQNSFQRVDDKLSERLKEVLVSNLDNHIVAIPDVYGDFENRTGEFVSCFRNHLADGARKLEYEMLDMKKEYYDSFISRPYKDFLDKSDAKRKFMILKTIWENRDLTIVEGQKSRLGVGNDLFSNAKSCIRILGPVMNAYDKYDDLLEEVKKTDKNRLVLIALGATATVLAYDLAKLGYQALDIGHIDIEYEWFLRGAENGIPIKGKYVNEVPGGRNVAEVLEDNQYTNEIIAEIF